MSSNMQTRTEHDLLGPLQVPLDAYYGVHTQRAIDNFCISELRLPTRFIHAVAHIKKAAAQANLTVTGCATRLRVSTGRIGKSCPA